MLHLAEIKKAPEGIAFSNNLDILESIKDRYNQILDLTNATAVGQAVYEDGFYLLDYQLSYQITLPSSRSLEPVKLVYNFPVSETFIEADQVSSNKELVDEDLVLILEENVINLEESVIDNILLNIPLKVLTEQEENGKINLSGNDWEVLTEEDFDQLQQEKKESNSPFAQLEGLFDQD
ncbi:DUF177 domain-containing protein [Streptococcus dentiloxodontae]